MEIKIAKICGLCGGCQNAINKTLKALESHKKISVFKQLVHNDMVNNMLTQKGAATKNSLKELVHGDIVVLRAHGEPPATYDYLHDNKIKYIDCTCRLVKKIHELAEYYSEKGYTLVLIGKSGHPEIVGTLGYINGKSYLVGSEHDIDLIQIATNERICVLYQTTFNEQKAAFLFKYLKNKFADNEVLNKNTICPVQKQINSSALELASECDIMIVVGNKNSSNTVELYNNLKKTTKTLFIQDLNKWQQEFERENVILSEKIKIGITAGASTRKEDLLLLKNMIMSAIL